VLLRRATAKLETRQDFDRLSFQGFMIAIDACVDQADGRSRAALFGGGSTPADERNRLTAWPGAGRAFVRVVVVVEIGCRACIDHTYPALGLAER
jgi:hypothetical protein